jgi:hypothetical protein
VYLQNALGYLADALGDPPAVEGLQCQDSQDDEVQGPMEEVRLLSAHERLPQSRGVGLLLILLVIVL